MIFETTGLKGYLRRACRVRSGKMWGHARVKGLDGRGGIGEAKRGRNGQWGKSEGTLLGESVRREDEERECVCGMLPPDQVKPELETAQWIQRRRRRGGVVGSPGIRSHHSTAAGVKAPKLRKWRLNSLWKWAVAREGAWPPILICLG